MCLERLGFGTGDALPASMSLRRVASFLPLLLAVAACASASEPSPSPSVEPGPAPPTPAKGESEESKIREKDESTWIAAALDAEAFDGAGLRLTHARLLAKVDGAIAADETFDANAGPLFPRAVRLHAPKDRPDARVELTLTARMGDTEVVSRKLWTRFSPGRKKLAYVRLEAGCNRALMMGGDLVMGPECGATETCISRVCRSPEVSEMPDFRDDWAESPPSACGEGPTPELSLGKGEAAFTTLTEGETVTIERGPQCGHHVWLAIRAKNLSQWKTITTMTASQPGGPTILPTARASALSVLGDGSCELAGLRFQLDIGGVQVKDLLGKPLDLTLEAKDAQGRSARLTRRVQVADAIANPTGRPCGD